MENEKRLIDANALCDRITATFPAMSANAMYVTIEKAPTVDAVEVVHAKWIKRSNGTFDCSVCHIATARSIPVKGVDESTLWNYCPNCGAKMDGGRDQQ